MKRLIAVLSGLLVLPAFAEVAPISYDEIVEYSDELIVDDVATDVPKSDTVKQVVVPVASPSRGTSPRSGATNVRNASPGTSPRSGATNVRNASRVVPAGSATTATRNVATRASASSRNATTARTTTTRASGSVVSRNANASRVSARPSRAATTTAPAVSSRRATTSNASRTARAGSIIQTDTVNTPLYTGRVGVRSNAIQARMPVASGAAALSSTATTSVDTDISDLDELAQITDYCKAQYTSCMDNFCNVLDDAQGRCSCSANLKNYEKTQNALKQANEDLQDVAQQIQYIGLSSEEIETIFSETEAELAMKGKDDNSDNAVDLSRVKDMVIDVRKKTAYSTTSSGTSFDLSGLLSFDFATDFGFDSLFGSTSDTSSISNQRGDQLYKTATARCKATVLNTCQSQGVDISVITNAYDLEIDKQCIAYERSLTDANDQLVKTVRNAQTVLQRARLMVAQKKNEYDGLRECITALDACMQDDYVCGSDYENCLDPTGKYIVNGKVIEGSTPGDEDSTSGLYATWNYKPEGADNINAWGTNGSLKDYITTSITDDQDVLTMPSDNMLVYLQSKIGYYDKDSNKNYGMCIGELNKCQKYSYGPDGEYDIDNQVVREYMQRTLVQIKAAQDELLAKYAENCVRDVATCVSRNASSASSITRLGISSCSNVIKTCMSVNGESNFSETAMMQWVVGAVGETTTTSLVQKQLCENSGGEWNATAQPQCKCNVPGQVYQDQTCGYVISGGEYALGQTRFVPNVSNAAVSLPALASWTYTDGQNANKCYYVYQNGTEVKQLNGITLPVGFNGSDIFVACGELTDEELCIKLGKYFYSGMCISGEEEYNCRITTGAKWENNTCECPTGYKLDNQKCVELSDAEKCEKEDKKLWGGQCITSEHYDCIESHGSWDGASNSCTCPTKADSSADGLTCVLKQGVYCEPFSTACSCTAGYYEEEYGGSCISAQEKCKNTLGEWTTDGECSCIMDLSENPTDTTDYCVPVDGAYMTDTQYSCRAGYVSEGGGTRCVSREIACTNEGKEWYNGECLTKQEKCTKQKYYWYADGNTCITSLSEYNCRSTGGGWVGEVCRCGTGYELDTDGKCVARCNKITITGASDGLSVLYRKTGEDPSLIALATYYSDENCTNKYEDNYFDAPTTPNSNITPYKIQNGNGVFCGNYNGSNIYMGADPRCMVTSDETWTYTFYCYLNGSVMDDINDGSCD